MSTVTLIYNQEQAIVESPAATSFREVITEASLPLDGLLFGLEQFVQPGVCREIIE